MGQERNLESPGCWGPSRLLSALLPCSLWCGPRLPGLTWLVPILAPPAVAGAWAVWEAWGPCSVSCGGGHRSRRRSCVDPPPKNGGAPCPGASQERAPCGLQPCTGGTGKASGAWVGASRGGGAGVGASRGGGAIGAGFWASWYPPHLVPISAQTAGWAVCMLVLSFARRGWCPHALLPAWIPRPTEAAVDTVCRVRADLASRGDVQRALQGSVGCLPALSLQPPLPAAPRTGAECPSPHTSGCRCPPGLLLHDSHCLPLSQCPCLVGEELKQPGMPFLLDNCSQW